MDHEAAPLIVTADDQFLDDALRWCAAAGATPEVVRDVTGARRAWRTAPVVLVGEDLADRLAAAGLPRRELVLLVVDDPERWWPVAVRLGAADVIDRRTDEARVLDVVSSALDGRGEACVVSIVGGSGGVGASTFAATLGLAGARRGLRSLLVDLDPLGGGIDLVLGAEDTDGVRWSDLDLAHGRLPAGSLGEVLPASHDLAMLTWGADAAASLPDTVGPVVTAAGRAFDFVVADVPRHLGTAGREVVGRSVLSVLVVAEEVRALGAARQVLDRLLEVAPSVAVVSVARRGGVGEHAVEVALGRPVLARLRPVRGLRTAVDRGHGPPGARRVRRPAAVVLDTLGLDVA